MLLVLTLCIKGFIIHYVGKYYPKTMKKHIKEALSWLFFFIMSITSRYPTVLNKFFGIREFPYLKLGIRDFKAKSGCDSG